MQNVGQAEHEDALHVMRLCATASSREAWQLASGKHPTLIAKQLYQQRLQERRSSYRFWDSFTRDHLASPGAPWSLICIYSIATRRLSHPGQSAPSDLVLRTFP